MMNTKSLFAICLTVLLSFNAIRNLSAQGPAFEVNVTSDSILLGNYFIVEFKIINSDGRFEAPSFEDFDIIGGPNVSTSFQFINGESSQEKIYIFHLKPRSEGVFYIPPAFLSATDTLLETAAIEINVLANPDNIITNPQKKNKFFDQDFSFPFDLNPLIPAPEKIIKKKRKGRKI